MYSSNYLWKQIAAEEAGKDQFFKKLKYEINQDHKNLLLEKERKDSFIKEHKFNEKTLTCLKCLKKKCDIQVDKLMCLNLEEGK